MQVKSAAYYLYKSYVFMMRILGSLLQKNGTPPDNFKSIIINRSDRLGDAAVSLPVLRKLAKQFNVTVISSDYNDELLRKGGLKTIPISTILKDINQEAWLLRLFRRMHWIFKTRNRNVLKCDVYLNPVGSLEAEKVLGIKSDFSVGMSYGFYGFRYSATVPPFHGRPYLQVLIDMIKTIVPDFEFIPSRLDLDCLLGDKSSLKVPEEIFKDPFIVFHVGGKPMRLLNEDIVVQFLNSHPLCVMVIDAPGRPVIQSIMRKVTNKRIVFVQQDYTLWELLNLTKHKQCKLFIGYDSGSSHILHMPTNALIVYTGIDHISWRPYTGTEWSREELQDGTVVEKSSLGEVTKAIAYRPVACRPCYDIDCKNGFCKKFNLTDAYKSIANK